MADFLMPALGADMTTGELVQWHVRPGDAVQRGDVVAVVETHKGAIDVEIFLEGVIDELAPLHVPLAVGARLARVRPVGERAAPGPGATPTPDSAPAPAPAPAPAAAPTSISTRTPAAAPAPEGGLPHVRATPAARRHAQALHLSLEALAGTGPHGAVTREDVERAGEAARAAGAADARTAPPTGKAPPAVARGFDPAAMRAAIAAAMVRSKREIPHFYLTEPVPLRLALDWLRAHNEQVPVTRRILPAALLIKAVARALCDVPGLNGHHVDGVFRPAAAVHVGLAISLHGGGLVAPALHDVQDLPLEKVMAALADLVRRARTGLLRSSEVTDPTVTVTALGDEGADSVLGVIHPPQVALVGFGRVRECAWVEADRIVAMPVVQASLSMDHRVGDGRLGSAFLAELAGQLQQPQAL